MHELRTVRTDRSTLISVPFAVVYHVGPQQRSRYPPPPLPPPPGNVSTRDYVILLCHCKPVLRIWIRDPVPFRSDNPGSGMGKKPRSGSGSGINEHTGTYFRELRNNILG
jgi:hypothetical protein